ncbi:hypothetical protein [Oceanobacillus oncorhynchi]|uniref:hypothetical protein n=1 Tax=Oceanobacillus oncorhynchi TaxID=545501 RepID=UPI0021160A2B|nr:hypothetical protein [Oceanobacillus oncorhynchi]UUI41161.1 hypothetical protein NP440_06230 [Oceanobacillus oncorhynchi]
MDEQFERFNMWLSNELFQAQIKDDAEKIKLIEEFSSFFARQVEKVQKLQKYRNANAKFLVDLNEFLQQRSKKMPVKEVWGLHVCDVAMKYIPQLENENKRYEEALEFYADVNNHGDSIEDFEYEPPIYHDNGGKARRALKGEST